MRKQKTNLTRHEEPLVDGRPLARRALEMRIHENERERNGNHRFQKQRKLAKGKGQPRPLEDSQFPESAAEPCDEQRESANSSYLA